MVSKFHCLSLQMLMMTLDSIVRQLELVQKQVTQVLCVIMAEVPYSLIIHHPLIITTSGPLSPRSYSVTVAVLAPIRG